MAAILVGNYQNIASFYAGAQDQLVGVTDYYYNAATEIVNLQVIQPEIDLLSPFYNAYLAATSLYAQAPQSAVKAVKSLQDHVLTNARTNAAVDAGGVSVAFSDINDWIDAAATNGTRSGAVGRKNDVNTSFQIPSSFASMSGLAGHPIEGGNIL